MKRKIALNRLTAGLVVCVLTAALAAGCGSGKKEGQAEKADQAGAADTVTAEADAGKEAGQTREPPATGEMADSQTDALGNPVNDDGVYYDEDGNIVPPEEMVQVDEDGNPISEEDMMDSEGDGDDWSSVEYSDRESFEADIKTGYEEVTRLPFEASNTFYMLYANGVYEIQYENDTSFLTFTKGRTEDEVNRITVAFDKEETVDIKGAAVKILSYENDTFLATWSRGDYYYSIYLDSGCTRDQMIDMVDSVK
ncbi:MAG: DUF4367 domain-containing protein [Sarcina sp.]|nr:DUF4367 domain-containing protein [Sarcina sp.]